VRGGQRAHTAHRAAALLHKIVEGSITKQFTAAAILQLAERGKLALSDPLGKWVPEYGPGRRVTLEQLLWQVSGIPDYTDADAYWKLIRTRGNRAVFVKNLDLRDELALIAGKPLAFRPGSAWAYSNTNYALLAAVVAKASGVSWKTYVLRHLLAPAGMTDSGFVREPLPGGELATGYGLSRRTGEPIAVGPMPGGLSRMERAIERLRRTRRPLAPFE